MDARRKWAGPIQNENYVDGAIGAIQVLRHAFFMEQIHNRNAFSGNADTHTTLRYRTYHLNGPIAVWGYPELSSFSWTYGRVSTAAVRFFKCRLCCDFEKGLKINIFKVLFW